MPAHYRIEVRSRSVQWDRIQVTVDFISLVPELNSMGRVYEIYTTDSDDQESLQAKFQQKYDEALADLARLEANVERTNVLAAIAIAAELPLAPGAILHVSDPEVPA